MTCWLGEDVIRERTALTDEIIGILTTTIERLRSQPNPATIGRIREERIEYDY